jgi:hypothetical protein
MKKFSLQKDKISCKKLVKQKKEKNCHSIENDEMEEISRVSFSDVNIL